jgi:UTP--glucose-1-phosphate uridylyltransferase
LMAVVPAAGLGTRLLPATKEQPKEMLPVFTRSSGGVYLKPMLQLIFERLFDAGVRDFCFVIGRGKRAIEDHFTPDYGFLASMRGKKAYPELEAFYRRLEEARILWVNQPEARGFGEAVLRASPVCGGGSLIVHAGDTYLSSQGRYLDGLFKVFGELGCEGVFPVEWMEDPRSKGVVEVDELGNRLYRVKRIVEKPVKPPSNLAVVPIYLFKPRIFEALKRLKPGVGGELQLTDAIQSLIEGGSEVYALGLDPREAVLDIGDPYTYWIALSKSWELANPSA